MSAARDRILRYFLDHVGQTVSKEELMEVARISEWARRVRELRDEFGYDIRSFKEDSRLKPGEYVLIVPEPKAAVRRGMSKTQWFRIIEGDGHKCVSCGREPGDPDPTDPDKTIRLVVDHKKGLKGRDTEEAVADSRRDENLATFCNVCNEGKWDLYKDYDGTVKLDVLAAVRHSSREEKKQVYSYLMTLFEHGK